MPLWVAVMAIIAVLGLSLLVLGNTTPVLKNGQTIGSWAGRSCLRALLFVGAGGLILLAWRKRILTAAVAPVLALALHSGELVSLGGKYLTLGRPDWSKVLAVRDGVARLGAFRESFCRVMIEGGLGPPEAWSVAGLEVVSGYDPMQVDAYVQYIAEAEGWDSVDFRDALLPDRIEAPEYDLLNVKYALTRQRPVIAASQELRILGNVGGHWVVERNPFPRAFWVASGEVSEGPSYRLLDLDKESASEHQGEYRRISPGEIEVRLDAPEDGYLFLSEVHFPGWKAERISAPPGKQGKELEIHQVNNLFRLVPVSAGEQTIRVRYRPLSFLLGCAVTIGAVIGWLAALVHYRRTVRRSGLPGGIR